LTSKQKNPSFSVRSLPFQH